MKNTRPVQILLVEDDEVDAESMLRALRKLNLDNPLLHARDGCEALELLRAGENGEGVSDPYLIVLDINMPKMNGIEFLEALRRDEEHKNAIVFVLTTSNAARDKVQAYEYNIAGYLLKSNAGKGYTDVVGMLEQYWRFVELPTRPNAHRDSLYV